MAAKSSQYRCSECGHAALTWTGQCSGCGAWNTLEEVSAPSARTSRGGRAKRGGAPKPVPLRDVKAERSTRLGTGIAELDRVLGGGLVPGSLVLLGGAPGIGKSTLAGMALANIAGAGNDVLYVSGEESAAQVRRRAERLGEAALSVPMLAEPSLESVLAALESERPAACVIDSVQTLAIPDAAPGSVGAVREATSALLETAKRLDVTLILIGHVTKEGSLAGPRALEHLVDCVLHFEGERERTFRTLRALKNRFGATSEVGVFEMKQGGLVEVVDPSARFVGEARPSPGSVVLCSMEGTRPLLVEVQALVAPDRDRPAPPHRDRRRPQPPGTRARRPDPPCGHLARDGGRLRQRGGRGPHRRAGRRPCDRDGGRLGPLGPAAGVGRQAAGLLRRDRPDRRDPLRGPRGPPSGGGPASSGLERCSAHHQETRRSMASPPSAP